MYETWASEDMAGVAYQARVPMAPGVVSIGTIGIVWPMHHVCRIIQSMT